MEDVKIAVPVLTVPEYAKQIGSTAKRVRTLCEQGILPAERTDKGHWRIKAVDDYVSREVYEKVLCENSRLLDKLKNIEAILKNV